MEDSIHVQQELTALLAEFGMTLRKWRTNRTELRDVIPGDLLETEPLHFQANTEGCPKALGIHWNTTDGVLFVLHPENMFLRREKRLHMSHSLLISWVYLAKPALPALPAICTTSTTCTTSHLHYLHYQPPALPALPALPAILA